MENEAAVQFSFRTGFKNVNQQIIMHELLFHSLLQVIGPEIMIAAIQQAIDDLEPEIRNSEIEKKLTEAKEFLATIKADLESGPAGTH